MKNLSALVLATFIVLTALPGCSSMPSVGSSLAGINIEDLKELKSRGDSKDFALTFRETYELMLKKVYDNGLTPYLKSPDKGYIIVIGFEQQVNTTRIGIFIDSVSETSTRVTLTSKSSTALDRARLIFFDREETDVTVIE
jgi:hypothetical protein